MKYTEDFISRVKKEYPTYTNLHKHIDNGSEMVGRYLEDSFGTITENDVMLATSLNELREKAIGIKIKKELYKEWFNMYRKEKGLD